MRLIYKSNICRMKMLSKISEEFLSKKGLVQSYCMSSTLFKIEIDIEQKKETKICEKMGVKLTNEKFFSNVLFAYDPVVIAQDRSDIEYLMRKLLDAYKEWGLSIILIKPIT